MIFFPFISDQIILNNFPFVFESLDFFQNGYNFKIFWLQFSSLFSQFQERDLEIVMVHFF